MTEAISGVTAVAAFGVAGGLVLLFRGFRGYRAAERVAGIGTSRVVSLAVGEVRVTGTVEPVGIALVSPLQSAACVYYRSRIHETEGRNARDTFHEERAIGFRLHDPSGTVRIFPRGARWDVPDRLDESTGLLSNGPIGLNLRTGPATMTVEPDRAAAVEALLTVHAPIDEPGVMGGLGLRPEGGRSRRYTEARLEAGETVTIVGWALPFSQLDDPSAADIAIGGPLGWAGDADPEVEADLAAARAAGILETDPAEAWGNAAIPGFGIGRPTRSPTLDPAARAMPLGTADEAERAVTTFDIEPEALVIAASATTPLSIAAGTPGAAAERGRSTFLVGLLGAALAIASAVVLAASLSGAFG